MDSKPDDLHDFFGTRPREYRVERHNDLDMLFTGWEISRARLDDHTGSRWTEAVLYMSTKGSYVVNIRQGGISMPTISRGAADASFTGILKWMREDNRGALGGASKRIVAVATERLPWLSGEDVVHV